MNQTLTQPEQSAVKAPGRPVVVEKVSTSPAVTSKSSRASWLVVFGTVAALVAFALSLQIESPMQRHLSVGLAIFFLLFAFQALSKPVRIQHTNGGQSHDA